MSGPVAVLIGPPGSGKSTVARAVGARLRISVRDTDSDVEKACGRRISDIFVEDGESAFRELEHQAVLQALAEHDGVLSVGGGAVLDPRTEAALAGHLVIFLDVRIADAARRIGFNRDRPLLLGNPRAQWTMLMDVRRPIYERLAGARVDTAGRDVDEVTAAVLAVIAGQSSEQPVTP